MALPALIKLPSGRFLNLEGLVTIVIEDEDIPVLYLRWNRQGTPDYPEWVRLRYEDAAAAIRYFESVSHPVT